MTSPDVPFFLPNRRARFLEPIQRLEAEIARTQIEISQRRGSGSSGWVHRATALVNAAQTALQHHRMDAAWALLLDARRTLVPALTAEEQRALATSLRVEAGKYRGWRQKAVEQLLEGNDSPGAAALMEALFHIDSGHANQFRELRSRRNELLVLMVVLILSLATALGVLLVGDDIQAGTVSLGNEKLIALAPLLGILGACVSTIQRSTKRPSMKVPDQRAAALASIIRPMTGAGAGFVVLAGAQAGLVGDNVSTVLLAAFAAGFSERYILRFVPDVEPSEPDTPTIPAGLATGNSEAAGDSDGPNGPYFRASAGMVVINQLGAVLALERADAAGSWQFPQGGIEDNETPLAAAYRELREETGLEADDVELVAELPDWLAYELPAELRSAKIGLGQVQRWFLFRLRAPHTAIDLAASDGGREFVAAKWISIDDLVDQVADFRKPVYRQIQEAVKAHASRKADRHATQRRGT